MEQQEKLTTVDLLTYLQIIYNSTYLKIQQLMTASVGSKAVFNGLCHIPEEEWLKDKTIYEYLYIVGIHRYSFRVGKIAKVIGIYIVKPFNDSSQNYLSSRIAYRVQYEDGVCDSIPVHDAQTYKVGTKEELEQWLKETNL